MSSKFALKARTYYDRGTSFQDGYYTGAVYQYQKEQYAATHPSIMFSKLYAHLSTAERACEALNNRVVNYQFDVVEVFQDGNGCYVEL